MANEDKNTDFDLTYSSVLTSSESSQLSALYPPIPKDYWSGKGDVFKREPSFLDLYETAAIRPYVKVKDLNNSSDSPYENTPKSAIEFWIRFSF